MSPQYLWLRIYVSSFRNRQSADIHRPFGIDFLNFSPKIKRISDEQKQQLMDSGRKGAQAFLARVSK